MNLRKIARELGIAAASLGVMALACSQGTVSATAQGKQGYPNTKALSSVIGDGKYHILSNNSASLVLHAEGSCTDSVSTVDIDKRSNNPYYQNQQLWMFAQNSDGTATISDRCVYGNGNPSAVLTGHDGTVDLRAPASDLAGQKWQVSEASSGVLTITDAASGKALDSAGTSEKSAVLETTPDANSATQHWTVVS